MIASATLSVFDISTWNPNVSLELGMAVGLQAEYYILFNKDQGLEGVPSDLGGIDRLQYSDFASLKEQLRRLMEQQFGAPEEKEKASPSDFNEQFAELRQKVPTIVGENPGAAIGSVASQLGVQVEVAQILVKPLVGNTLETQGERRGTKYFLKGAAPTEDPEGPAPENSSGSVG